MPVILTLKKVRQEDCRLKTSLSYIYIARACLKEYGRNIILGFLRGKMNIADYCTVIKCGLGKYG